MTRDVSPLSRSAHDVRAISRQLRSILSVPWNAVAVVLAAASVSMLLWRFVDLHLAAFILDEPKFLAAALEQVQTGRWVTHSPLIGTQGVHYGPSVLWFYGVVQWVFGSDARIAVAAMCLLLTASHLFMAVSVTRAFGGGVLVFAMITALIAASPFQFFWSRLAWDQLVNVCAATAVGLLALQGPPTFKRCVALGLCLGVAVSSHLMSVPFVAVALAALALQSFRNLRTALAAASAGLVLILFNVPYLRYVASAPTAKLPKAELSWALLPQHLVEPARVASVWRIDYFFDAHWSAFVQWAGWVGRAAEHAWIAAAVLGALAVAGLAAASIAGPPDGRRIARIGLVTWVGYGLFYALRALVRHPHYQFPTWWVVPVGAAALAALLLGRLPKVGRAVVVTVIGIAALQFVFILQWMRWIEGREGTRGIHYGPTIAAQISAVKEACRRPEPELTLDPAGKLFPPSLGYLAHTLRACAGKKISVCPRAGCPPSKKAKAAVMTWREQGSAGLIAQ